MKKFLAILSFLFCVNLAYAGLSVDPSVTNISENPGSVYKGKYKVKNTYDKNISVSVEVTKGNSFSANKDADINKWLVFEKYKYFIPAGESVEVPYTVKIDENFKGSISSRVSFSVDKEQGQMISISIRLQECRIQDIRLSIQELMITDLDCSLIYILLMVGEIRLMKDERLKRAFIGTGSSYRLLRAISMCQVIIITLFEVLLS